MMNRWRATSLEEGQKLVDFLHQRLSKEHSKRKLKAAIENNNCRVNTFVENHASYRVKKGDRIAFQWQESPKRVVHTIDPCRILFEDSHLLIYNKPEGMLSEGVNGFHPVHRLDQFTTGALLYAKHEEVQKLLEALFRERKVNKGYYAIVDGCPDKEKGRVESYIGKVSKEGDTPRFENVSKAEGRHAETVWFLKKKGIRASLIECHPITGRTHQIRLHMKLLGLPILGDTRYTKRFSCSYLPPRPLLHAYLLSFTHPLTKKNIAVIAPLPDDFREAFQELQIEMS